LTKAKKLGGLKGFLKSFEKSVEGSDGEKGRTSTDNMNTQGDAERKKGTPTRDSKHFAQNDEVDLEAVVEL
jgi:hypothetical protein